MIGQRKTPGVMNKLESAYHELLDDRFRRGEVLWFRYEAITLKLAHDTRLTPDFAVMLADRTLEFHETKGPFAREDSLVKLKCAAEMFPAVFRLVTRSKDGAWDIREVGVPRKQDVPAVPSTADPKPDPVPRNSYTAPFKLKRKAAITEAHLAAWRPGSPLPDGYALMDGRLVTRESALDAVKRAQG